MSDNFDVFGFLEGRTYPEEQVKLFVDEESALAAKKLVEQKEKILANPNVSADEKGKAADKIDKQLKALAKKAEDSALVATLQGTAPGEIQDVLSGPDKGRNSRLLALLLKKIASSDGKVDERTFTEDDANRLEKLLPTYSWGVLNEAAGRVITASMAYSNMADSGFFQKS